MRAKGQEPLAVSSSLVLSIISKDQFLAHYIDDCNMRPMGDARQIKVPKLASHFLILKQVW